MSFEITGEKGVITVSYDVIGTIVGAAVTQSYGVVGMTSKKITDGLRDILKQHNYKKGIHLYENEQKEMEINIHIVVSYGTKISEITTNIQEQVKYDLEHMLGIQMASINIFVEDVRVER